MTSDTTSFSLIPHRRVNILTGERVLVSPHRNKRPWQGQMEEVHKEARKSYDKGCYLCPGNQRAGGVINPKYTDSYVFINDFSALLPDTENIQLNDDGLLIAEAERGICKVISFSPRHDLTLAEMEIDSIEKMVNVWQEEFFRLAAIEWIHYIQIFENKGSIMGCSNPHPHGQIWGQSSVPVEVSKENYRFKEYYQKNGRTLLADYLQKEIKRSERVIIENEHFVVLVPFWAAWPFETLIISKRPANDIRAFNREEKRDLARTLQELTVRYDNIFQTSFPYSAGIHQAPVNSGNQSFWHWHMHFYPPLLRSATIKKFMVGYEMLGDPQRDFTPEYAAEIMSKQSKIHYKKQG